MSDGKPQSGAPGYETARLDWLDERLAKIPVPSGALSISRGLGSGLARRASDPPGTIWAIGDRGPNLKVKAAIKHCGLEGLRPLTDIDGAKIMPCLDHGPALAQLRIEGDKVTLLRVIPLRGADGRPLSGLPPPESSHSEHEPIFSLGGERLGTDPSGVDSEGIVALSDGSFFIGDEYGPSLLKVDRTGRVLVRWVPAGLEKHFEGATYKIEGALPAIAAARRLNRGFEALALAPDEASLLIAFQSPLAHPDRAAHERSRHVRIWRLDVATGALLAEYLYPLDPPAAFERDLEQGPVEPGDVKVSEAFMLDDRRMVLLERVSASTKFHSVELGAAHEVPARFSDPATRPTIEQMDEAALAAAGIVPLTKSLIFDTDRAPEICADLEGAILLGPCEMLLVNDNDFGVEGVKTQFWRVRFDRPIG
ncbi:MAG TPA: esterase-like activity of phytase family protein [Allosphingosinicella sp.]